MFCIEIASARNGRPTGTWNALCDDVYDTLEQAENMLVYCHHMEQSLQPEGMKERFYWENIYRIIEVNNHAE